MGLIKSLNPHTPRAAYLGSFFTRESRDVESNRPSLCSFFVWEVSLLVFDSIGGISSAHPGKWIKHASRASSLRHFFEERRVFGTERAHSIRSSSTRGV